MTKILMAMLFATLMIPRGSSEMTEGLALHGAVEGNYVTFSITNVGDETLEGSYSIVIQDDLLYFPSQPLCIDPLEEVTFQVPIFPDNKSGYTLKVLYEDDLDEQILLTMTIPD